MLAFSKERLLISSTNIVVMSCTNVDGYVYLDIDTYKQIVSLSNNFTEIEHLVKWLRLNSNGMDYLFEIWEDSPTDLLILKPFLNLIDSSVIISDTIDFEELCSYMSVISQSINFFTFSKSASSMSKYDELYLKEVSFIDRHYIVNSFLSSISCNNGNKVVNNNEDNKQSERLEKKLDNITDALNKLTDVVSKIGTASTVSYGSNYNLQHLQQLDNINKDIVEETTVKKHQQDNQNKQELQYVQDEQYKQEEIKNKEMENKESKNEEDIDFSSMFASLLEQEEKKMEEKDKENINRNNETSSTSSTTGINSNASTVNVYNHQVDAVSATKGNIINYAENEKKEKEQDILSLLNAAIISTDAVNTKVNKGE